MTVKSSDILWLAAEERPRDFSARLARGGKRQRRRGPAKAHRRGFAVLAAALAVPALAASGTSVANWMPSVAVSDSAQTANLMPFEQAGQSFPGSAFYYLDDDISARPAGLNSAAFSDTDQSAFQPASIEEAPLAETPFAGPAARAFLSAGSGIDKSRALQCLSMAIYYEARSEADVGQRAVAQVVLNRVAHPAYPGSVCGVVFQGSERRTGCQFSFTCDGSMAKQPRGIFWHRARRVASDALAGRVYAPVGYATHYHTLAVNPYWASSLQTVGTIGFHRFYRWKGKAGTASAFRAAYNGREPMAAIGPIGAGSAEYAVADTASAAQDFLAESNASVTAAPAAPAVSAAPSPAYVPEVAKRGGDALYRADNLPSSSGVRPEYVNAGKWIAEPN